MAKNTNTRGIVVIGFAESLSAPEVVWSLSDYGYGVMAFTRKGMNNPLRKSKFAHVFEITAPEKDVYRAVFDLAAELENIRKQTEFKIAILPLDDVSALLMGKLTQTDGICSVGPIGEQLDVALDKKKQVKLAEVSGFHVPKTVFLSSSADLDLSKVEFPLIFKSALAVEEKTNRICKGKGWICADESEFANAMNQWGGESPMMRQPFISGVGEGIFGVMTDDGVIGWSGHRRLRMMNPHGSGASACISTNGPDFETREIAEKFLRSAGWRGLFMIELLRDHFGKLWFIEFNGRAWGSMALARRGGFEYPAWAIQTALRRETHIKAPAAKSNLVCRHLGREILHLLFVLRGSKSKALTEWPSFWRTCIQIFHFSRNDHWYNWRKDDRSVFFSDLVLTLRSQLLKGKG